jgi:hypothetical protein
MLRQAAHINFNLTHRASQMNPTDTTDQLPTKFCNFWQLKLQTTTTILVCLHENFQRPNRRSQNQNDPKGPTDPKIKMTQMTPQNARLAIIMRLLTNVFKK